MRPVRYLLILLCVAVCCAAETEPAAIGGPAPGYDGVQWLAGGSADAKATTPRIQVVVFWACDDGADQPALEQATALMKQARVVLLADSVEAEADELATRPRSIPDQGVAGGEVRARWLGSEESPLPAAVLIGADGILLWRGRPSGIAGALAREQAHQFDRAALIACAKLRQDLHALLEAQPEQGDGKLEQAFELTAQILVLDAIDEEAIRLRLDLSRHLEKHDAFRKTLADIPRDRLPADFANSLAWERVIDEDLAWRCLDQALQLIEHACVAQPDEAAYQDTYARVLYALGLIEDAIATQLRAVSLAPENPDVVAALSYYQEVLAIRTARQQKAVLPR